MGARPEGPRVGGTGQLSPDQPVGMGLAMGTDGKGWSGAFWGQTPRAPVQTGKMFGLKFAR